MDKNKIRSLPYSTHKLNFRQTTNLNKKNKTLKILEGNTGEYLYDLGVEKDFLKH